MMDIKHLANNLRVEMKAAAQFFSPPRTKLRNECGGGAPAAQASPQKVAGLLNEIN